MFLKAIAASANVSEERVVLFDDDHRNVAAAVKAGFMGAVVGFGSFPTCFGRLLSCWLTPKTLL